MHGVHMIGMMGWAPLHYRGGGRWSSLANCCSHPKALPEPVCMGSLYGHVGIQLAFGRGSGI